MGSDGCNWKGSIVMKQIITKDTSAFWETKKGEVFTVRKFISMKENITSRRSTIIDK
jgi:hypothetical protein